MPKINNACNDVKSEMVFLAEISVDLGHDLEDLDLSKFMLNFDTERGKPSIVVKQRPKLTRFKAKTASKIDHPKHGKTTALRSGEIWDVSNGNKSQNTLTLLREEAHHQSDIKRTQTKPQYSQTDYTGRGHTG